MSNLKGSLPDTIQDDDARKPQIQVNSLDYLVSVDRLAIHRSEAQGVYHYGGDNNYPRKIIQSADRESSLVTARNTQSKFVKGMGFPGATAEDVKNGTAIVINSEGETLYDLLDFCANEKSNINIAIHVNYNALGEAVEFNLIQYDFVRRKVPTQKDKFTRYIITNIWHLENDYSSYGYAAKVMEFNEWVKDKEKNISFTALECFDYNPDPLIVREQIEMSGGIENYPGQLFYKKRTKDIYQKAIYDSVSDDFQFLAETKLGSLSNIQNGYSAGGIFKHFGNLTGTRELEELKKKMGNATGAKNMGRIIAVGVPDSADMRLPVGMFESTQLENIDKLYESQKRDARESIKQLFNQPNSLIGKDTEGNFATQNMEDAFDFYNAVTSPVRQELEIELTTLITNSIYASQVKLPIEIEPLVYESSATKEVDSDENEAIRAESQAKLKGTVGGVQGILGIQESVSLGKTQYEAAIFILKDIYGYTDEEARQALGKPVDLIPDDAQTIDETTETNTVNDE
jgi:hypothetical protein